MFEIQIIWENRKYNKKPHRTRLTDYDGIDCPTTKQGKSNKAFYSHKYKASGLRYSIASCIETGDIVHIDGPLPAGDWPDISIFRSFLKWRLDPGERINADAGYAGEDPAFVVAMGGMRAMELAGQREARGSLRNRHETINKRMKQFKVLFPSLRHSYAAFLSGQ